MANTPKVEKRTKGQQTEKRTTCETREPERRATSSKAKSEWRSEHELKRNESREESRGT